MGKVKAIFISHEHSDHINGLRVLSAKYRLPVYITPGTLNNSSLSLDQDLVAPFTAYTEIRIGNLSISAFPKFHDAAHPHSFIIEGGGIKVGVFTDIGVACTHVISHFKQCHAAFLEANYDVEMLENGRYPYHLKRRIRGGQGHLSNSQALEIFINHRPVCMSHLLLAHLSRDNNDPQLVYELFNQHAHGTEIVVASRYQESEVYHVSGALHPGVHVEINAGQLQYTLF